MWCDIFAWGKDPGQDDLHHLLSPCEHLSTPKHNIQLKIKTLNSNSVDFKGFQREFSPNSAQEYHQLSKNENFSFAIFTANYKGKKTTIELKMESLSQMATRGILCPPRKDTDHWLCFPARLSCWLGAAHRKHGSITAMQWSLQELAPSVSYTSWDWRSVSLGLPSKQGFGE